MTNIPGWAWAMCKGSYALGTACGKCQRCVDELRVLKIERRYHASDCAIHNAPAEKPSACDCDYHDHRWRKQ